MAKNKFYAVKRGLVPGIYESWDECKVNVIGFPGAIYKGFPTIKEAEEFLCTNETQVINTQEKQSSGVVAYIDGSFDEETNYYACGVVIIRDGHESYFSDSDNNSEMVSMRNVAGEILGAKFAMQYAIDNGISEITLVHDYQGIACWCTGEWKTNKIGTRDFKNFYDEIIQSINVEFQKVKGHNGEFYNELADALAKRELGISIKKTYEKYLAEHEE